MRADAVAAALDGLTGEAVIANLRGAGRGPRHLVVAQGGLALVRAKKVNAKNAGRLTFGQLRAADPSAVVVADHQLLAADVWQCPVGGRITLVRRNMAAIELRWVGRANAQADVESVLGAACPGRVDQVTPDASAWLGYLGPRVAGLVAAIVLVFVGGTVIGNLLSAPPAAPKEAPPTTLAPQEVAIRAALGEACPPWGSLLALPRTALPAQGEVRAAVDASTPRMVEAAQLDPAIAPAEAEVAWLGRWSVLPPEEAARESAARLHYALRQVDSACAPRG